MLAELRETLSAETDDTIDWITFVGSGEPTLNSDLGTMLRGVKAMTDIPVAVITNGSFLASSEVRQELSVADAVMPTLDAGNAALFKRINRPPAEFSYRSHLDGLIAFGSEYKGKLWLEVMLMAGLNDGEAELEALAAAIALIAPAEVHLVLPTRPPAESWVRPTDDEGLLRARAILGRVARVVHPDEERGEFSLGAEADPVEAAAKIIARHPIDGDDLRRVLSRWGISDPEAAIRSLVETGRAVEVLRYGKNFWRAP
jgi:wyosine [tRNA(Phe)-imidazoG37] synthetase (radical SAM superfamily)